jgi:hypothetical protein
VRQLAEVGEDIEKAKLGAARAIESLLENSIFS